MELGYYWAHNIKDNDWRIVQIVDRLPDHVLDGGYAWPRAAYSEYVGPLRPSDGQSLPEAQATLLSAPPDYDDLRPNYEHACRTIDAMHAAAMGEICAPKRGVVEDVRDLRHERDYLAAKLKVTEVDLCRAIDDLKAKLEAAQAELHDLRIRVELGDD